MKRYHKPKILFESFIPNSSIGSCTLTAVLLDGQCGGLDPDTGWIFFVEPYTGCELEPFDGENICYHNSSDSSTVFGS